MTLTNIQTKSQLKGSQLKKDLLDSDDEPLDSGDMLGDLAGSARLGQSAQAPSGTDLIARNERESAQRDFKNSFRNVCETKKRETEQGGEDQRDCMTSRERNPDSLLFSKQLEKDRERELVTQSKLEEEEQLSGDEAPNPFEQLEEIHQSKMKQERESQRQQSWIDKYQTDQGEEKGAEVGGSRVIGSELEHTIRLQTREKGPEYKGRQPKQFEQNQSRRPIELRRSGRPNTREPFRGRRDPADR